MAASDTNPLRVARRPRQRGPDRAPRRGRRAAAPPSPSAPLVDRGRHRGRCSSRACCSTASRSARRSGTASTTRRWRSRTPASRPNAEGLAPVRGRLLVPQRADARRLPRQPSASRSSTRWPAAGARPRRWSVHVKLTLVTSVDPARRRGRCSTSCSSSTTPRPSAGSTPATRSSSRFFLSAMTRSGGFSTIDIADLNGSSLLVDRHAHVHRRRFGLHRRRHQGHHPRRAVPRGLRRGPRQRRRWRRSAAGSRSDVLRLAVSVVLWGATIVAVSSILILQITKAPLDYVLFDVISAFATCGLSTGLTAELPDAGRLRHGADDVHGPRWYSDTRRSAGREPARASCSHDPKRGPSLVDRIKHDAPVLVIGLGRFGAATRRPARPARPRGARVDDSAALVQKWSERVTHAVQADARTIDALAPDRRAGLLGRRRAPSAPPSRRAC